VWILEPTLPIKFWGESILTATHLINRTPSSVLKGKTPYEVLFTSRSSYDMLHTFGCLCYAHIRPSDKDKFASRSRKCVFIGYPHDKKAWRVSHLETGKIFASRDVQEDVFPLSSTENPTKLILTTPSILADDDWFSHVFQLLPDSSDRSIDPVSIGADTRSIDPTPSVLETATRDTPNRSIQHPVL